MIERQIDERNGTLIRPGEETVPVKIIDRGEDFDKNGEGQIPNHDKVDVIYSNHDKVEIIYIDPQS